jgi:hypothetical protein
MNEEFLKSYQKFKNEIISTYSYLEKDKTTTLNLNIIKDFLFKCAELTQDEIKIKDTDINDKILVLTDKEDKKYLCFENGKKIVMTKSNFDLSNFNHSELLEILRFLDITISDNSYDYLRSQIVEEINLVSNVSILKN